jgi:tetratricopeptide (TPR) repeat protein
MRRLDLARRVIKSDPNDPDLPRMLGLAEYRSGHWNEATNVLSKAIERDNDPGPRIYFLLAMAEWRRGDRTEALHNFSRGLEGMKGDSNPTYQTRALRSEAAALLGQPLPRK